MQTTSNTAKASRNGRTPYFKMNAIAVFSAISIVILLISFLVTGMVYASNKAIPYPVILISCFLLLELLLFMTVSPLAQIGEALDRKKALSNAACAPEDAEAGDTPDDAHDEADTQETLSEKYAKLAEKARNETVAEKKKRKDTIIEYVRNVMPALLDENDLNALCVEIEEWIDDHRYKPMSRDWKWKTDTKYEVKHIDMRHLFWNIGVRMGMDNGYGTYAIASFIKNLFPKLCANIQHTTLSQCLKADPLKGNILIDDPDTGSYAFHYGQDEE